MCRFGSYEPQLASFVSLPYLGSTFADGHPLNCVSDFDNAGLMIGTSSCDFNPLNIANSSDWTSPNALGGLVSLINDTFGALQPHAELDATSLPNPFFGIRKGTYQDTNETALELVDGSLDDQNDPLFPLLVKARKVDMIVILDSVSVFEVSVGLNTGSELYDTVRRDERLQAEWPVPLSHARKDQDAPRGLHEFSSPIPELHRRIHLPWPQHPSGLFWMRWFWKEGG